MIKKYILIVVISVLMADLLFAVPDIFDPSSEKAFTIVLLPDTQNYSKDCPAVFRSQTQWIANNIYRRNIIYVAHLGDIVQDAGDEAQWHRARKAMSSLDGAVPYGVLPGNHDQPTKLYNKHFSYKRYEGKHWYGGHYPENHNDNNYQLFGCGGFDFIAVNLEYDAREGAIDWARGVFSVYPDRIGILTTHAFLNKHGDLFPIGQRTDSLLWDCDNIYFVFCGHVPGSARRVDKINGRIVHQMLSDYQGKKCKGLLRVLLFVPEEGRIYVDTYSPMQNKSLKNKRDSFFIGFPFPNLLQHTGEEVTE